MSDEMKIININQNNLAEENICCAFSDKKHKEGVSGKQDWICSQYSNGFKYKKLNIRGKVFIEYTPAEKAWAPVIAPGYLLIHCFWVAGKYKASGWGKKLLQQCEDDAKNLNGIIVVSSTKKRSFLADKKYFLKQGYETCDKAEPFFELLVKKNNKKAPDPKFNPTVHSNRFDNSKGFSFVFTSQCPFTPHWSKQLESFSEKHGIPFKSVHITDIETARNFPSSYPLFNVFYDGKFITNEILTEKKFDKLVEQYCK